MQMCSFYHMQPKDLPQNRHKIKLRGRAESSASPSELQRCTNCPTYLLLISRSVALSTTGITLLLLLWHLEKLTTSSRQIPSLVRRQAVSQCWLSSIAGKKLIFKRRLVSVVRRLTSFNWSFCHLHQPTSVFRVCLCVSTYKASQAPQPNGNRTGPQQAHARTLISPPTLHL